MSRDSTPLGCTPAGSGRAGVKRRLSSALKARGGVKGAVQACTAGIRKLARRAGVIRVGKGVLDDPEAGMPRALKQFLRRAVERAAILAEHARRMTITGNDAAIALKQMGITVYGVKGADWTYGFYCRERVHARIARTRLPQALLDEAAAQCAASQAGSVPEAQQPAQQQQQQEQQEPAAVEQSEQQQQALSPAPSVAHSAAAAAAAAERLAEQQELAEPAAAAAGTSAKGAAPAGERRLSGVPTPAVVTEARAAEVQAWMAEEMLHLQRKTDELGIRRQDLRRVMGAKHGCSAAEVQHVLFCLERLQRIMFDGDTVYLCS